MEKTLDEIFFLDIFYIFVVSKFAHTNSESAFFDSLERTLKSINIIINIRNKKIDFFAISLLTHF